MIRTVRPGVAGASGAPAAERERSPSATTGAVGSKPPAILLRAARLVRPPIERSIGSLASEVSRVASYHLGFTDEAGDPAEADGGKALRPALALLSARAAGGDEAAALPGAVAIELVHNFSLLHDDVMDRDEERRHRPSAWTVFGIGPAIVAGDALLTLAQRVLLEEPSPARVRAASSLSTATERMIAGQARDLAFESRLDVSYDECLAMSANKTGALLASAASIGAILADGDPVAVRGLEAFGLHLGLAFQAVDDVLGIWGRPEVTGKPAANDLRARKATLPVVAALRSGTPAGRRLARLLSKARLREADVEEAVGLIEDAGGRAEALREARRRVGRAAAALDRSPLRREAREELLEVAAFVTRRES